MCHYVCFFLKKKAIVFVLYIIFYNYKLMKGSNGPVRILLRGQSEGVLEILF